MLTPRDAAVACAASATTLLLVAGIAHHAGSGVHSGGGQHQTTLGRAKATGERAFVLSVGLQFQDHASADALPRAWRAAAAYCIENEPFLFAYEVAQSDPAIRHL